MENRPKIAVSACLLGDQVRYNGGHKHQRWLTGALAQHVDFLPLCPEVDAGLGVPRPAIRLIARAGQVRAETVDSARDVTQALQAQAERRLAESHAWDGLILMQKSPSCGLFRTKLYNERNTPAEKTSGLFAGHMAATNPLLPMEEGGRLNDQALKENFLTRVFLRQRWRDAKPGQSAKALIDFHSRCKYLVLAHSQPAYQALGQLLSDFSNQNLAEIADTYYHQLFEALARPPSRGQVTNVLHHIQGYLKDFLGDSARQSIHDTVIKYRTGEVPLIVPLTLIEHHLQQAWPEDAYIRQQFFLNPYPEELGLRNAI